MTSVAPITLAGPAPPKPSVQDMLAAESSDKFEPIANFAGVDRVTMLRRFMHCRSVLAKDYVVPKGVLREGDEIKSQQYKTVGALSPGWLLVNYATQENVLDELTSMMNNQLLVSALLLTVCLPYQFAPPDLAFQPELIDWFLAVNGAAASLYFLQILAGVVLYENIIRRPFGEMAAYIRYAQCSGTFLIWWNSVFLSVFVHGVAATIAIYGASPQTVAIWNLAFFAVTTLVTMKMLSSVFFGTNADQVKTTNAFFRAYCDQAPADDPDHAKTLMTWGVRTEGDLTPEWKKWLAQQMAQ